ncbi:MAG: sigma-70 family RNA polymerase sigma factor [Deltaproteobacteria bacterium]|nr:MAG: sigma-70 family RNA polymerase sigma factor [Deltaproteobacteria bacterium]
MDDSTGREAQEARWRAWMIATQAGDAAAYDKLLAELLPRLRQYIRRRVFDVNAQEDVVQNVFLSLHRARHTYRAERPFSPWLYAVARNAVIDYTRSRGRRLGRELSLEADAGVEPVAAPADPHADDLAPELIEALQALPDNQREAVTLIHLEGLSVAVASERAGVSKSALKVRAHRGYRALHALLEDWERE